MSVKVVGFLVESAVPGDLRSIRSMDAAFGGERNIGPSVPAMFVDLW